MPKSPFRLSSNPATIQPGDRLVFTRTPNEIIFSVQRHPHIRQPLRFAEGSTNLVIAKRWPCINEIVWQNDSWTSVINHVLLGIGLATAYLINVHEETSHQITYIVEEPDA